MQWLGRNLGRWVTTETTLTEPPQGTREPQLSDAHGASAVRQMVAEFRPSGTVVPQNSRRFYGGWRRQRLGYGPEDSNRPIAPHTPIQSRDRRTTTQLLE